MFTSENTITYSIYKASESEIFAAGFLKIKAEVIMHRKIK